MAKIYISGVAQNQDIQPAIQAAHDGGSNGDEIILPDGDYTMLNKATLTKFISIKGAGKDSTILYRPETLSDATVASQREMIHYNISSRTPSNINVRGIGFKSKLPSINNGADGLSLALDSAIRFTECIDWVVTGCDFKYFGNGAIDVHHYDDVARGLIYDNSFYWNAKGAGAQGFGYGIVIYGQNDQWLYDVGYGSDNFVFIENNTFDVHRHAIACGGSALYVARYNTITNNVIGANSSTCHAIDAHGAGSTSPTSDNRFSTRGREVYNNTITNTIQWNVVPMAGIPITSGVDVDLIVERAIHTRGGEGLIYSNTIYGYRFGIAVSTSDTESSGYGNTYPIFQCPGYFSDLDFGANHTGTDGIHGKGDLFEWNNTFWSIPVTDGSLSKFWNYSTSFLTQNRDYHLDTAKPDYIAFTYPHPRRLKS